MKNKKEGKTFWCPDTGYTSATVTLYFRGKKCGSMIYEKTLFHLW